MYRAEWELLTDAHNNSIWDLYLASKHIIKAGSQTFHIH